MCVCVCEQRKQECVREQRQQRECVCVCVCTKETERVLTGFFWQEFFLRFTRVSGLEQFVADPVQV